jgi:Na+-transporting NADH:ubiquinone oxidoreductase subunit NqrC
MVVDQNKSKSVKLWVLFGLFIGLIVGLIVYEVKQYVLATEQRENYEAIRKKQSEQLNEVYNKNVKAEDTQEKVNSNEPTPNNS